MSVDLPWFRRTGIRRSGGANWFGSLPWEQQIRDVEALFYYDDPAYRVTVGAGIQSVTDQIPSTRKPSGNAPYVAAAPTIPQRPVLAGTGAVFTAANASTLAGAPLLAGLLSGLQEYTWMTRVSITPTAPYQLPMTVAAAANDTEAILLRREAANTPGHLRQQAGAYNYVLGTTPLPVATALTIGGRYTVGPNPTVWLNGVDDGGVPAGTQKNPAALDVFAFGSRQSLTPVGFLDGTQWAAIVVLRAMSASEILRVHTQWAARFP